MSGNRYEVWITDEDGGATRYVFASTLDEGKRVAAKALRNGAAAVSLVDGNAPFEETGIVVEAWGDPLGYEVTNERGHTELFEFPDEACRFLMDEAAPVLSLA